MLTLKNILGVGLFSLLLFSCSPAKMMQRAIKKDPSLLQTKVETVYIPTVKVDTFYSIDTVKFKEGIDSIFLTIPGCDGCSIATKEIVRYITDKAIIPDTLSFSERVINDSVDIQLDILLWQEGNNLRIKAEIDKAFITVKDEIVVVKEPRDKIGALRALVFVGLFIVAVLGLIKFVSRFKFY